MLPGPVFNVELLTTARRARYYLLRFVYGSILLLMLWENYEAFFNWRYRNAQEISVREMADFALNVFLTLIVTQGVGLAVLIPVLFAGAIADEKQRKTLHYLLASRLTSAEIVLGKLAARLLHVGVFLGVGLPIVSLMTLLGGIPPDLVVGAYFASLSGAFLLAGVSLLVSSYARRPRDAIVVVYLLELAWLLGPIMLQGLASELFDMVPNGFPWDECRSFFTEVYPWVHLTNPFFVLAGGFGMTGPAGGFVSQITWMIVLQVAAGGLAVALAVIRLRPVFRNQSIEPRTDQPKRYGFRRLRRQRRRPDCGLDPLMWKEFHVGRPSGLVKRFTLLCVGFGLLVLLVYTLGFAGYAVKEMGEEGYFPQRGRYREDFNALIRISSALLYILWCLGLAVGASSSFTSEREEDTWISLLGTTLTPPEYIRGKMLGAAWRQRGLLWALFALWGIGLLVGAVSVVGISCAMIELGVFTWFVLALGTRISLSARSSLRATASTAAILIALNGGYLMCCIPMQPNTVFILTGCTPFIIGASLLSYTDIARFMGMAYQVYRGSEYAEAIGTCISGVILYAVLAWLLTNDAIMRFDEIVDRPRRLGSYPFRGNEKPPVTTGILFIEDQETETP